MTTPLSPSAQRVQDALLARGVALQVVEMPSSTRTSVEAAAAVGCDVAQIAKSLIFKGKVSERPLLVIACGSNRVDEKKLAAIFGEKIEKPDADYVRARTGFVIGGVPPVGHNEDMTTLIDEDLLQFEEIWGAAGTPNAVFRLTPGDLVGITGGVVVDVKKI
ncbi:MAG: YbaK/EbsC family protein [Caldilineaceae bacterium]|nr:YbaK/EbsC family protein [Caldilineaceae bacterium]